MIKSVTVRNFKPHEDTTVEFPNGVTVITGVSDEGKSAFYQALKWPILNKPNGSAFHSNWISKDKVVTEVAIRTEEDRLIQRIKKKGYDVYILDGNKDDPFEALNKGVPEDVQKALNLSEINLRSQHESFFLLNDTAGDVAKKLNRLVGLDIIDSSLKNINRTVKTANQEASNATNSAIEKEQTVSKYKNVDDLLIQVGEIEKILFNLNEYKESQNKLQQVVERVSWAEKNIKEFTSKIETETDLNIIIGLIKDQEETEEIEAELQSAITNLQSVNEIIKKDTALTDNVNKINKILELDKKAETLSIKTRSLEPLIEQVNNLSETITEYEYEIKERTKQYDLKMKSLKICPLCNQKIKDKK